MMIALLLSTLWAAPAQAMETGGPDKTMYDWFVTTGTGLEFGLPRQVLVSGFGVRGAWSERSTLSFDLRHVGRQSMYEAGDPDEELAYAPWRPEVGVDFALTGSSAHGWQLGAYAALQRVTVPEDTLLHGGIQTSYRMVFHPGWTVQVDAGLRLPGVALGPRAVASPDPAGPFVRVSTGLALAPQGARAPGYRSHAQTGRVKPELWAIPAALGLTAAGLGGIAVFLSLDHGD